MSSDLPRHSGALYSPADDYPPSLHSSAQPPRWSRAHSIASSTRSGSRRRPRTRLETAKRTGKKVERWVKSRWVSMTLVQKVLGVVVALVGIVAGVLFLIYHKALLHQVMEPVAAKLRSWKAGWLLFFVITFLCAFPPMIGYSTVITLSGFVYGFPNGWFIIASATLLGATSAFLVCRHFLRNFAKRMVATDKRFAALSLTLKHDGVKLLVMIRLCPLPYSVSNGALSTFPSVTAARFAAATAFTTPKLLIHVWIGARLAALAEDGGEMDLKTKMMNYFSIALGVLAGVGTGWFIYKRTMRRAAQLEAEERAKIRDTRRSSRTGFHDDDDADDDEDYDAADAPLAGGTLDEEAASAARLVTGLIEGDEESGGFFADLESDLEEGDDDEEEDGLLGDETENETETDEVAMVPRRSTEILGKGRSTTPPRPPPAEGLL